MGRILEAVKPFPDFSVGWDLPQDSSWLREGDLQIWDMPPSPPFPSWMLALVGVWRTQNLLCVPGPVLRQGDGYHYQGH